MHSALGAVAGSACVAGVVAPSCAPADAEARTAATTTAAETERAVIKDIRPCSGGDPRHRRCTAVDTTRASHQSWNELQTVQQQDRQRAFGLWAARRRARSRARASRQTGE